MNIYKKHGKKILLCASFFLTACVKDGLLAQNATMKQAKPVEAKSYRSESFQAFETGPVRPLAMSMDKKRLFSVNTPDNSIEVFNITKGGLQHAYTVPVGLEPVSIAVYNDEEIWVVNHLSDNISVVELKDNHGYVKQTILVGDEPRDIVFAGNEKRRAFITVAHRGQNAPFDPKLETDGIGRADVWVFDPESVVESPNPKPDHIINLFSDTPRALAVSPNGDRVYAAAFHSGNQTTVLKAELIKGGLGKPAPHVDAVGAPQPLTGLIVKYNGKDWVDNGDPRTGEPPKVWTDRVRFSLPDKDIFVIDSNLKTPQIIEEVSGVGTTLFNIAVNPKSGVVYVSNTDAMNHIRFATDPIYGPNLRGRFIKNQISIIDGNRVIKRELNPHIWSTADQQAHEELPIEMFPIINPSFESEYAGIQSVKGWESAGDSELNITDKLSVENKRSMKVSVGEIGEFAYSTQVVQRGKHMRLKEGQRYRVKVRVYGKPGTKLDAQFQNDGSVEGQEWTMPLGSTGQVKLEGAKWEELNFAFRASSDYGVLVFNLGFEGNRGATFYFDDVRMFSIPEEISIEEQRELSFGTESEKQNSLAIPLQMVVSQDGKTLYVAAYGSQAVGVFNVKELEDGSFTPDRKSYIPMSGGGPAGLLLNESENILYVYTRFDNSVAEIDLANKQEAGKYTMYNPEPKNLIAGRKFLYDARLSSSRGDLACASCHVFGDTDHLAWDLGDPMGISVINPNTYIKLGNPAEKRPFFHPLKGPMVTQSMRGLAGNGPMHWRGDKTGASRDEDESQEEQAFEDFNKAFVEIHGMREPLSEEQMQQFTEFALQLIYPPNPIRRLDNSLSEEQKLGASFFSVGKTESTVDCNTCHEVNPAKARYGTNGLTNLSETQQGRFEDFKIPHLRNMYTKVGMFGNTGDANNGVKHIGNQIRGFGFNHDGTAESIFQVLSEDIFFFPSDDIKRSIAEFSFVINSELNPIVGQQITLSSSNANSSESNERLQLLITRANVTDPVPECDLSVKGILGTKTFGALFNGEKFHAPGRQKDGLTLQDLILLARDEGNYLTFTCVPPGSGHRIALGGNGNGNHAFVEQRPMPKGAIAGNVDKN